MEEFDEDVLENEEIIIIIIIIIIITFISIAQIQQFSFQMRLTILEFKSNQHCPNHYFYNHYSQIKSNEMLVFDERGKPEYPGENLS